MLSGGQAASELHIKCGCTETWPQSNYARKQEEPLRLIWLFRPASLGSLGGMLRRAAVWVGSGVSTARAPRSPRGQPETDGLSGGNLPANPAPLAGKPWGCGEASRLQPGRRVSPLSITLQIFTEHRAVKHPA